MGLSFGQLEAVLAHMHDIVPEKRGAFQSRLKQWQKMRFPEGVNVGRGVKVEYDAGQFFQLVVLMDLLRIGLTPERAIQIIRAAWPRIQDAIAETMLCRAYQARHIHYLLFQINSLSELQGASADHMHVYVRSVTDAHMSYAYEEPWNDVRDELTDEEYEDSVEFQFYVRNNLARSIILELDSMLARTYISREAVGIDPATFSEELVGWIHTMRERGHRHTEEIPDEAQPVGGAAGAPAEPEQVEESPEYRFYRERRGAVDLGAIAAELLGIETPEEQDGERPQA